MTWQLENTIFSKNKKYKWNFNHTGLETEKRREIIVPKFQSSKVSGFNYD